MFFLSSIIVSRRKSRKRRNLLFHTEITALELCSLATEGTQEITEIVFALQSETIYTLVRANLGVGSSQMGIWLEPNFWGSF